MDDILSLFMINTEQVANINENVADARSFLPHKHHIVQQGDCLPPDYL